MTAGAGVTGLHLRGMLNSPFGCDVYCGDLAVRGLLSREERQDNDGNGFAVPVYVTALSIDAADLPDVKVRTRLEVGPMRALWNPPAQRKACTVYEVRRVGRIDDVGGRELILVEVTS
jgi:hypothetical protein